MRNARHRMKMNLKVPIFFLKAFFFSIFLLVFASVSAQENSGKVEREVKKYLREAEAALEKEDFATAEALYRQAIARDPGNAVARYNLGNLYYRNDIPAEAVDRHSQAANVAEEKPVKHNSFHNQGNSFMKQKKYSDAVEAYKNSLRNDPADDETRYNLALAKKMLEEEQQGGGGDESQDQDQEQKEDQDKQQQGDGEEEKESDEGEEKEKQEGGDQQSDDKKEGDEQQDDEGKPQNDEKQDDKGGKQDQQDPRQQQPLPGQLSPEQVKSLLEAMGNEEKKVQDKINAEKAKGAKVKSEKDW